MMKDHFGERRFSGKGPAPMIPLPEAFKRRIVGTFGHDGEVWLQRLSSTLEIISRRWSLTIRPAFENLSYNYISPAVGEDGTEFILKIGVPNKELTTEIKALRLIDGSGAVQLLQADPGMGAMLLEALRPGKTLFDLEEDELATSIAAQVMSKLWRSVPEEHIFPKISDWAKGFQRMRSRFDGRTGPFQKSLVEAAENIYDELLGSASEDVLLHGDLHHWNILSAEREPWLAIDPKGVIGERAYEVGAWLRNPFPHILRFEDPQAIIVRRVRQFNKALGFNEERLLGWGLAQAVLAGWWSFEEHDDQWQSWIELAEIFAQLL
jgi:streptomycin 6-kinase